jgi:hypothetical protein
VGIGDTETGNDGDNEVGVGIAVGVVVAGGLEIATAAVVGVEITTTGLSTGNTVDTGAAAEGDTAEMDYKHQRKWEE